MNKCLVCLRVKLEQTTRRRLCIFLMRNGGAVATTERMAIVEQKPCRRWHGRALEEHINKKSECVRVCVYVCVRACVCVCVTFVFEGVRRQRDVCDNYHRVCVSVCFFDFEGVRRHRDVSWRESARAKVVLATRHNASKHQHLTAPITP